MIFKVFFDIFGHFQKNGSQVDCDQIILLFLFWTKKHGILQDCIFFNTDKR